MYEGELYQNSPGNGYIDGYSWKDDQAEVSDVTETSFTLKRKFEKPANEMYEAENGEVTFRIVFDENAKDWRIEQKDVEYEY